MAQVIVTIAPDGKTTVEADGWTGPTCQTVTKPYRDALGVEVENTNKPEFYQQNTTQTQEAKQ